MGDGFTDCRLEGRLGVALGAGEAARMLAKGFGPNPLGCGIRLPVGPNVGVSGCCGDRGLAKLATSPVAKVGERASPA